MQYKLISALAVAAAVAADDSINITCNTQLTGFVGLAYAQDDALKHILYNNLYSVNGTVWIGDVRYQQESEPLIMSLKNGSIEFLSIHSSPTGSQSLLYSSKETVPLNLTTPHGPSIGNMNATGFEIIKGNLTIDGKQSWTACNGTGQEDSMQINWQVGPLSDNCVAINITTLSYGAIESDLMGDMASANENITITTSDEGADVQVE